ncbi:putative TadZ/CpaE, associated with Flp pilus assembly [Hyphomicrobiales bacterium]|nr:putative TadZ/CpaE, associated with Flp pilus assembly [Hyphomicrobiales bacterium]CAH1697908.1 putative TadZ/CpaE, associated with Flp pilus assembly [Hyphomicrobiales bacterium]CAI0347554.1 Pilus assembly protein [Hyphomicrobiales bacterium]
MFDPLKGTASFAEGNERQGKSRGMLRRFRRSQNGAAAVEFGFVALPFFMLTWAIIETGLMFWTSQVLEESVTQASRTLLTGESRSIYTSSSAAANAAAFRQTVCARAQLKLIDCNKLAVDVRTYDSFAAANTGTAGSNPLAGGGLNTSGFSYSQPSSNQIVVVRAVLDYKLFLTAWASAELANIGGKGSGRRGLVASVAFRAEPF